MSFVYKDAKGDELLAEIDATTADKSSLAKLSYSYNADDNVTSFAQAYLGKVVTASGAAAGIVGPWIDGIGNEPKTSSKSDSVSPRNRLGTFFAWCAPFVLALLFLLRGSARRRLGWLAPALLGVFLGGCGGCSSNDSGTAGAKASTTYLYDAANRLTAAQDVGPASYTYDAASNLTSIQTSAKSSAGGTAPQSYTYSSTNGITGATYFTYDGMSRLVRIVDKDGGNVVGDRAFTWCGDMRCAAHDNLRGGSPVVTRYFDQGVVDAGTALYQVRDLIGSVRQLVDATGKVRAQYDYDPYGNRTKVSGDVDSEIGYAGYYHHAASGLDLTLYRAYDPSHGRWLNRDPIGEAGGVNLYGYTGGNPINRVDPTGHFFWVAAGALAFAAADVAYQLAINGGNLNCVDPWQVAGAALVGASLGLGLGPAAEVAAVEPWASPPLTVVTTEETTLYRVWGGESGQIGRWLGSAPESASQVVNDLALPPGNSAAYVSEVTLPPGTVLEVGEAAPAFGQGGGGVQYRIVGDLNPDWFGQPNPLD